MTGPTVSTRQAASGRSLALRLRFPPDGVPGSAELAIISAASAGHLSLEIAGDEGVVSFLVWTPAERLNRSRRLLETVWPGTDVAVEAAPLLASPLVGWVLTTMLADALPLAPAPGKEFDLPTSLALLFAGAEDVRTRLQLVVGGQAQHAWRREAMRNAYRLTNPEPDFVTRLLSLLPFGPSFEPGPSPRWLRAYQEDSYEKAAAQHLFRVTIRFAALATTPAPARRLAAQTLALFESTFANGTNSLGPARSRDGEELARQFNARAPGRSIVLTAHELAALWHPPLQARDTVAGVCQAFRAVPSPRQARAGGTPIGRDAKGRTVYLNPLDRRMHQLVVGGTGTGKTTLVLDQFLADISAGGGAAFIDPKGDAVRACVARFPGARARDLVLFDPSRQPVVPFNPLRPAAGTSPHEVADSVVAALRRLFAESWGYRLERILGQGLIAVQALPAPTLMDFYTFLVDSGFRDRVLSRVDDEFCRRFWRDEFGALSASVRLQWTEPVLNRLQPFLGNPLVRRVVSGGRGLDLRRLMDRRLVFLADLAEGKLGEENSRVLANLLMSSFRTAALSRADVPAARRSDFFLFVDEAHAVAPATFVKLLSEARAFRLNLTLITQFLHQLPLDVVEALLANVGAIVAFRVGEKDAALLGERFRPEFAVADLVAQDNYRAAVRMVSGGESLRPFTLFTNPLPPSRGGSWVRLVRDASLRRYATSASTEEQSTAAGEREAATLEFEWEAGGAC